MEGTEALSGVLCIAFGSGVLILSLLMISCTKRFLTGVLLGLSLGLLIIATETTGSSQIFTAIAGIVSALLNIFCLRMQKRYEITVMAGKRSQ